MSRVWVVLLAGCGFQSPSGQQPPPVDADPDAVLAIDAPVVSSDVPIDVTTIPSGTCWKLDASSANLQLLVCTENVADHIDVDANVVINTSTGESTPSGFACAMLSNGPDDVCVLAATLITIRGGKTLTAHGDRPLALLAHDIDLQGTIDVSSRAGQRGPASNAEGCSLPGDAKFGGGGGGGGFVVAAANGGDQGGAAASKGTGSASIGVKSLRGGCDGGGGGSGVDMSGDPHGAGGAGGGAVWLSVDPGTLTIGLAARINASGAGGPGGVAANGGGGGGGSGGLIVLQARTIERNPASLIFADGGGGGGGAIDGMLGQAGKDPTLLMIDRGGDGGDGGSGSQGSQSGDGGDGAPMMGSGEGGQSSGMGGGGGGGGSIGLIWLASTSVVSNFNVVPPPINILP